MDFAPNHKTRSSTLHLELQSTITQTYKLGEEDPDITRLLQKGRWDPSGYLVQDGWCCQEQDLGEDQLCNDCPVAGRILVVTEGKKAVIKGNESLTRLNLEQKACLKEEAATKAKTVAEISMLAGFWKCRNNITAVSRIKKNMEWGSISGKGICTHL